MSADMSRHRRRRLPLSLLLSALAHLVLLWAYQRWFSGSVEDLLRPVRFERLTTLAPEPYRPAAPKTPVPADLLHQLRAAPPPERRPFDARPAAPALPEPPGFWPEADGAGKGWHSAWTDSSGLDRAALEAHRRKWEERQQYQVLVLPDADTSDAASRSRLRAEAIVDQAIEAMGGLEALMGLRDMTVDALRWDGETLEWVPAGSRMYREGRQYREDMQRGMAQGFDGRRSWRMRFGIPRPPPDLREIAERWDFLSRYRGEGILLEYGGPGVVKRQPVELVHVLDAKYGRRWTAYFDVNTHLLRQEKEGRRVTVVQEHRRVGEVLLPYEVWIEGWGVTMYRRETQVNTGLAADLFSQPEPRTWERDQMRLGLYEHLALDTTAAPPALEMVPVWQLPLKGEPTERKASPASLELFDYYLRHKLRAAGGLGQGKARWSVECPLARFYVAPPEAGNAHRLVFRVAVRPALGGDVARLGPILWEGQTEHRWVPAERPAIDDEIGEIVSRQLMSQISAGLAHVEAMTPDTSAVPPRVRLDELWQETPTEDTLKSSAKWMPGEGMVLLDYYLRQKLEAAGALAEDEADWTARWTVEKYNIIPGFPPVHHLVISIAVAPVAGGNPLWTGRVAHRWSPREPPAINDHVGEAVTRKALSEISTGLRQVGARLQAPSRPDTSSD